MTKQQYKNLSHAFRLMKQYVTEKEALAWIAHNNYNDAMVILRVYF